MSTQTQARTAVVHLVWGPLGAEPLRGFLTSYRERPAGAEHELVVLFNGVERHAIEALLAELAGVEHSQLQTPEPMQDLAAYAWACRRLAHERLCFLNSHSRMLQRDWLAKLGAALDGEGVGLAGATGSWASLRSLAALMHMLPSGYRGAMSRRQVLALFGELQREAAAPQPFAGTRPSSRAASAAKALRELLRSLPETSRQLLRFDGFPNPHLRSNAFLVERARFAALRVPPMARKIDAHAFESGRASITRQLQRAGLRALVVDSAGGCHEQRQWARSGTLWQGLQERLLIADNQTRMYANGDAERRRALTAMAWGAPDGGDAR